MSDIPPVVQEWLDGQRRTQQSHVHVATANKNLRETRDTMQSIFVQVAERQELLDETEECVDELVDTSNDFYLATLPAWKRYLRTWIPPPWWCPCCYAKRQRKRN